MTQTVGGKIKRHRFPAWLKRKVVAYHKAMHIIEGNGKPVIPHSWMVEVYVKRWLSRTMDHWGTIGSLRDPYFSKFICEPYAEVDDEVILTELDKFCDVFYCKYIINDSAAWNDGCIRVELIAKESCQ